MNVRIVVSDSLGRYPLDTAALPRVYLLGCRKYAWHTRASLLFGFRFRSLAVAVWHRSHEVYIKVLVARNLVDTVTRRASRPDPGTMVLARTHPDNTTLRRIRSDKVQLQNMTTSSI